jgi:alpha-L-fucosidase 2
MNIFKEKLTMKTDWIEDNKLAKSLQRNEAFWDGELKEGPLMWITVPGAKPGTPPPEPILGHVKIGICLQQFMAKLKRKHNIKKGLLTLVLIAGLAGSGTGFAQDVCVEQTIPEKGIFSLRPAPKWEEGLLIGNGIMGGVVMGKPGKTDIAMAHERVYIHTHARTKIADMSGLLPEIRSWTRNPSNWGWNDHQKVREMVHAQERKQNLADAGKRIRWSDSFIRAGNLCIELDHIPELQKGKYRRSLDYTTGLAVEQWVDGEVLYTQRAFISRADNIMVYELTSNGFGKINGKVSLSRGGGSSKFVSELVHPNGDVQNNFVKEYRRTVDSEWQVHRYGYSITESGYEIVARVVHSGGRCEKEKYHFNIKNADKVFVVLRINYLDTYSKSQVDSTKVELRALGTDFNALLAKSAKIHGKIFRRVELDIGGGEGRKIAAEKLYEQTHFKKASPAAIEQAFYAGRYAIISSTGELPPNLQGKWNGSNYAPWTGSYTMDGNVSYAISNYLNGNMPELMLSYANLLEGMFSDFKINAKTYFGCRGIAVPIAVSPRHGLNRPIYPFSLWTAGAAWASGYLYDYYLYTGDEAFFRERALPIMKEAALFYEDYITQNEKGEYELNPSFSPENWGIQINSMMDIGAANQVLNNLIEGCTKLGIEKNSIKRWKALQAKLPPYRIWEDDGSLMEWCYQPYQNVDSEVKGRMRAHRHSSHFLPLWFGIDPQIANNPKLLAAAEKAVEVKEQKGDRASMGFASVQVGLAAASLGRGDICGQMINELVTGFYYPTFTSAHDKQYIVHNPEVPRNTPGPSLFNVDISGGMPSLVLESLVQSKVGELNLLPALPDFMPAGSVRGMLARGQVTIEELSWTPKKITVRLKSPKKQTINIILKNGKPVEQVTLAANMVYEKTFNLE